MAEQPQGTEYTLQGVMRFLQMEWHNHERARNAWDIERDEMKAKIAKQEGESRNSKKINDSLDKQIKMLEKALKAERARSKDGAPDDASIPSEAEVKKELRDKLGRRPDLKSASADLESSAFGGSEHPDVKTDSQRGKSRHWLQQCVQEFSYLLIPPAHPPPSHSLQSHLGYGDLQDNQPGLEDPYMQQRQRDGLQLNAPHLPSLPNHQIPHVRQPSNAMESTPQSQAATLSRERPSDHIISQRELPSTAEQMDNQIRLQTVSGGAVDAQVEKITHSFDAYGQPTRPAADVAGTAAPLIAEDGWNFDDYTGPLIESGPSDLPQTRRPDTDLFPSANHLPAKSPPRSGAGSHRRKNSGSSGMTRRRSSEIHDVSNLGTKTGDASNFKVRFALRGHLDVVRSIIFSGGGSPSEPEICTAGDDGMIKRWILPTTAYGQLRSEHQPNQLQNTSPNAAIDLDIQSYFSHRGHEGTVTSLAAYPASSPSFSTGGRALGDGWVFSGGQDATIRVWERGRVDPKAILEGHTDAVWTVCVLPTTTGAIFGQEQDTNADHVLLASGSADGTIKIWAVSTPPQLGSPRLSGAAGSRRGVGGVRRHSVTSGSGFPSSPQPSVASGTPFHYSLLHTIVRDVAASIDGGLRSISSPTSIVPLGPAAESFVVSFTDAAVVIFNTRTGEEIIGMASTETYDGTPATGVNAIVATATGGAAFDSGTGTTSHESGDEELHSAPTGNRSRGGVEGVVISGHEDRFIRFFDANSGQCTYSMLAHPAAIASLSLSPDGRELVSAGHDASLRFWSLEKRSCIQEISSSHRVCRGEGICCVTWSGDGRWVVSAGGDGAVKVFGR